MRCTQLTAASLVEKLRTFLFPVQISKFKQRLDLEKVTEKCSVPYIHSKKRTAFDSYGQLATLLG